MKSLLASVRAAGGLDRVDHAVQMLEDEWRRHGDVPLERLWTEQKPFVEAQPDGAIVLLAELIKTDLRCRFARGQSPTVADYLDRFPDLGAADSRVLSLIYEEFCLAEERGDRVDVDAFCERYPRWKESLVSQLQYHHLFSQAAGIVPKGPPFPEPGQAFEEFQLVALLGRGGTSRVFLARDLSLGGKQVVLKVSLDRGREPQAQGALDHPHIVPVNSVVFDDAGMRGLSMPYRPGLPLDEVIRRLNPASRPRDAIALWEALVRPAEESSASSSGSAPVAETPSAGPRGDGWDGFPAKKSFAHGAAWVVKIVAEALDYAHRERTFHRDVKPANILLTIQHGPQLLDFNLAESPHSASQAQAAMHGGTLPYMAPEQIEAFLNPDLWGRVGAQADLYSLGLVLRELLTGQAPDLPAETLAPARAMRVMLDRRPMLDVSVRRVNPEIPHALEAIVAKCLKVDVEERYPDARALVDDLDRFLTRRPLVHAVNPSRLERSANWGRRNATRLVVAGVCLLLGVGIGMIVQRAREEMRPPIPIQETEELRSAVAAINEGRASDGIDLLNRLAVRYSDSSLLHVYLGFALDHQGHPEAAEWHFRETIGRPGALAELVSWYERDPELPARLERFQEQRFRNADSFEKRTEDDEGSNADVLAEKFRLAGWALEISRAIRGESFAKEFDLARAEHELRRYESVIERAGKVLDGDEAGSAEGKDRRNPGGPRDVYEWRRLRARARTKLAERLRNEGTDPGRLDEGLVHLSRAEEDLKRCGQYLASQSNTLLDRHGLERIRLAGLVTRTEILLDLQQWSAAKIGLTRARDSLHQYEKLSASLERSEDVDAWYRSLNGLSNRLRQCEGERAEVGPVNSRGMVTEAHPRSR